MIIISVTNLISLCLFLELATFRVLHHFYMHEQVLPIANKMKTPEDFGGWTGVINLGMTIATCLYAAVGFFGYLKYGDDIQGSITLNLTGDYWFVRFNFLGLCRKGACSRWKTNSLNIYISLGRTFWHEVQFFSGYTRRRG